MNRLSGTTTLITGASSGIGKSIALAITELGGAVVISGRSREKLFDLSETLPKEMIAGVFPADLEDPLQCDALIPSIYKSLELPLTGFVHSAGMHSFSPLKSLDIEELDRLWSVNVKAFLILAKQFRRPKHHSPISKMIAISSTAATIGQKGLSSYSATKGALNSIVKCLSIELASEGIRVNSIAGGMIKSPMQESIFSRLSNESTSSIVNNHPLGLGQDSDIASAVTYLLSNSANWVTGTTFTIDGGFSAGKT